MHPGQTVGQHCIARIDLSAWLIGQTRNHFGADRIGAALERRSRKRLGHMNFGGGMFLRPGSQHLAPARGGGDAFDILLPRGDLLFAVMRFMHGKLGFIQPASNVFTINADNGAGKAANGRANKWQRGMRNPDAFNHVHGEKVNADGRHRKC